MGVCRWNVAAVVVEVVLIILFALFVEYSPELVDGSNEDNDMSTLYAMFQDVHVMIFIGFGFLMTFLYRYSYSSVSFNLLLAAILIQWATLCQGFWKMKDGKIQLTVNSMLGADIGAASFLISFGVLLGKLSPVQYIIIAIIEIVLFAINEHIVYHFLEVADVGGTIVVHTFGAYFGLACSLILFRKNLVTEKAGPSRTSDMFSMIGTVFLWLFWPSFNAGLASGAAAHRALINTYYSLASCTVFTFATTSLISKHNKLAMEFIQNATLAGGVAVGAAANMLLTPFGAMVAGGIAGIVSTLGFAFITPWLYEKCRIHDTCGVNNLHGMPGILGALLSAIVASMVDPSLYGSHIGDVFPAMAEGGHGGGGHGDDHGHVNITAESMPTSGHNMTDADDHGSMLRSSSTQALYQLIGLGVTLGISIIGGLLTGLLLKIPGVKENIHTEMLYEDDNFWEIPEENPALNETSSVGSVHKDHDDTKC